MPRRPGDTNPEPPGGRAAERLREFIEERFSGGFPFPKGVDKKPAKESPAEEPKGSDDEETTSEHEPPDQDDCKTP